ncbi:MAG: TauD/TfdA dioxygenase family protein [Acidimicrobiales bacterium]
MVTTTVLCVEPMTPEVGAIIGGIDLRAPLPTGTVEVIRRAVLNHGVVFFPHQELLTREQMLAFMMHFGTPRMDPFAAIDQPVPVSETVCDMPTLPFKRATSVWHIDSSLAPEPASVIALRAVEVPPVGGDTCWASMYAAYDTLSEPLREMLDGLSAVHSSFKVMPLMAGADYSHLQEDMRTIHPVIRVHPETGRKALFVDELWTEHIVELTPDESDHLLGFLFEHIKGPDFSIRWHWKPNDVALWDNRSFQHYAVPDYTTTRVMQKTILAGDRPYGPR